VAWNILSLNVYITSSTALILNNDVAKNNKAWYFSFFNNTFYILFDE
jgi:hypothetical protein